MKLFKFFEKIGEWRTLVQTRDIQDGAITTEKMTDEVVTTEKLADSAVTTEKIHDGAVTTVKIGAGEVKSNNIGEGEVKTGNIGEGEVHEGNIAEGAVTEEKILNLNVKERHIGTNAVTNDKIAPHAVTRAKLDSGAIPELLGVMDEFMAAVRAEIAEQTPITINGNVVNTPDEEDLTTVGTLLKLKDRSGLYGFAMKILRRNKTFAEQVTQPHCIYVIRYDFDLDGQSLTLPADTILLFDGGKLMNGTLTGSVVVPTEEDPVGTGTFGIMLCSPLYYDFLEDVTLQGTYQDETAKSLQQQINELASGGAKLTLTASKSAVLVGVPDTVTLTATTDRAASSIKIAVKLSGTEWGIIANGSGTTLQEQVTINQSDAGDVQYRASFTINGIDKNSDIKAVSVVYPICYGAQAEYSAEGLTKWGQDASHPDGVATKTVARTYTMQLDSTRRFIYFRVPKVGVTGITSVAMGSGSETSPVSGGYVTELEDANYRVWKSTDGYTGDGNQVFTVN